MSRLPFVAVIMPIRNEARHIRLSLGAVLAQDYPEERMEVIVADGMSDDGTREIVQSLQLEHPCLHLVDNPGRIVPMAMNAALRQAKGSIIVRVDGHTIVAPDYVRQSVSALERTGADNVGGRMNAIGDNSFGKAVALAGSSRFGVGGARFHYSDQDEWVDTVYMGAWPRQVFDRIGLFDEELVRDQDDEFNYRLLEHGGRIRLSSLIKSRYTVRSGPRSLWRQYYQYGFWKVRVMQKHPRQMRWRQFVPPSLVAALLGSTLLSFFSPCGRILVSLAAGPYLLANLATSLRAAALNGWRHLPLLPLVYAILHLSYGLGFLVGLVRFASRWGDRQGRVPGFEGADA